jgi:sugar/nucleoside kinase (ribokinase family)
MQACLTWSRAARAQRIPVVLDGGSWKDGTLELLKGVDFAICSADFMPPGCSSEDEAIMHLRACGVRNIAITKGAEPVRFVAGGASGAVDVPRVEPVDTMGAGDIFHGAFCYFYSFGCEFQEALRRAARIAAQSCRFHGAREWMKHRSIVVEDW